MASLIADPFRAARLLLHLRQEGVIDPRIMAAMETIDRAAFVNDPALAPLAFEDATLPIPCGQVILRPAATGHLLQALDLPPDGSARVLLVGFGAGYMAALLARLTAEVCAVDRFATLVAEGEARLQRLGIKNVTLRQADGLRGWPAVRTFDRIVLAGAVESVPETLLAQLTPDGCLAVPLSEDDRHVIVAMRPGRAAEQIPFFQQIPSLARGVAAVL